MVKSLWHALDTQSLKVSTSSSEIINAHNSVHLNHLYKSVSRTKVVIFGGATGDTGKYIITGDTYLLDQSNSRWSKLEGNDK